MPKRSNTTRHRLLILSALVVVVLVVGGILLIKHYNRDHQSKPIATITSTNPSVPGNTTNTTTSNSTNQTTNTTSNTIAPNKNPNPSIPTSTLVKPTGPFVSNHNISLSATGAYGQESSVCNTTPGATCVINFSKNGSSEQLTPETANADGAAFWSWSVAQSGLTQGSWTITAIASLNGQLLSSTDSTMLEVGP